ncbi:EmrB/QacA subfamily drug resistance transporter [Lacrimispora xylanisolvens]|uniref:EmrB/QacA subfamily drug resistance transporter n=1 Tax=Lacrimispora xylanisolvens TaxID=384636 RepID=A0A2S6HPE3_9FIRM|nr:MFS transporter [Hungatella xylanolytica]PPK79312.1 EmrB/QacA subfamily drug resistance transporter [Hungatella xylanolytica]
MEEVKKRNKWSVLIIVVLSTFMSTLDSSIVNVALPRMADSLGVTTASIQFVATSYLIVISGTVLIFGKLGDMFGKTTMFTLGVIVFTIGSLLCGLSHSYWFLIIARAIQAIGAAGTMANNQGIVTEVFPVEERGKALGLLGTAVALGSLVGPGLGGMIVGVLSWEYIFTINVPIGILAVIGAFCLLPKTKTKAKGRMDLYGALLFIVTIVSLFGALSEGLNLGFGHPLILTGFFLAAVCFAVFLAVEKKRKDPMIQLDIFKNGLFSLSIFCGFISFVAMFCNNIILPFYLQDVMEFSPQKAGLIMMAYPLILMVAAPVSGHLSDKIGSEILTFIGLVFTSIGLFSMSFLNENSAVITMVSMIGIMSVGMGLFQSPNNSLIMSTVSRDKLGVAGSINALVRNMGMVCGIALATTLLYGMMSSRLGYRVTDYIPGRNDAFLYGMHIVYITASAICMMGAVLTFFRLKRKKITAMAGK